MALPPPPVDIEYVPLRATFAVVTSWDVHWDHVTDMLDALKFERTRCMKEESTRAFDVLQDDTDHTKIFTYQTFADKDAYTRHLCSFPVQAWRKRISDWISSEKPVVVNRILPEHVFKPTEVTPKPPAEEILKHLVVEFSG